MSMKDLLGLRDSALGVGMLRCSSRLIYQGWGGCDDSLLIASPALLGLRRGRREEAREIAVIP